MITCKIFTLGEKKQFERVESASLDWSNQEVEILTDHAELFAAIPVGSLKLNTGGQRAQITLNGALVNFDNPTNTLIILQ